MLQKKLLRKATPREKSLICDEKMLRQLSEQLLQKLFRIKIIDYVLYKKKSSSDAVDCVTLLCVNDYTNSSSDYKDYNFHFHFILHNLIPLKSALGQT